MKQVLLWGYDQRNPKSDSCVERAVTFCVVRQCVGVRMTIEIWNNDDPDGQYRMNLLLYNLKVVTQLSADVSPLQSWYGCGYKPVKLLT